VLYRAYLPSPELRPYVKCYWVLRSASNPFPAAEPLIPDGCIELIFNLGAPYRRWCASEPAAGQLVKGSHLVGERTRPFLVDQLGAIDHVAVRARLYTSPRCGRIVARGRFAYRGAGGFSRHGRAW
jgi:hypothetical protein